MLQEIVLSVNVGRRLAEVLSAEQTAYLYGVVLEGHQRRRFYIQHIAHTPSDPPTGFERMAISSVEELLAGWDVVKWYGHPFFVHNAATLTEEERVRFDRLIRTYGEEHIRLIKSMTIGIIGLGRLGSAVFQALLESGGSRFILIDPDVVNQENKALWSYADVQVEEAKVEALQAAAKRFGAEVIGVQRDILELSPGECQLLYDLDFAFCCTDCLLPRVWLSAVCARAGIPVVTGGVNISREPSRSPELRGRVHICTPGHSCLFCIPDALPLEACSAELNRLTRGEQLGRPGEADPNLSALLARSAVHALHQIVSGTIPACQVDYELTQRGITAQSVPLRTLPSCEVCRPQIPRQQPQLETQQRLPAPSSEASSFKTRVWGTFGKAVVGLGTITAGVAASVVGAAVAFGMLLLIRHVIGYESLWRYSTFENILHFLLQFDSWRYYDHSFWNYLGLILSSYIVLLIPYILFGLPLFGVQRVYRALDARLARWRRTQALEEVAENEQYALVRDLIHNLRSRERILHVRPLVRRVLQRSAQYATIPFILTSFLLLIPIIKEGMFWLITACTGFMLLFIVIGGHLLTYIWIFRLAPEYVRVLCTGGGLREAIHAGTQLRPRRRQTARATHGRR